MVVMVSSVKRQRVSKNKKMGLFWFFTSGYFCFDRLTWLHSDFEPHISKVVHAQLLRIRSLFTMGKNRSKKRGRTDQHASPSAISALLIAKAEKKLARAEESTSNDIKTAAVEPVNDSILVVSTTGRSVSVSQADLATTLCVLRTLSSTATTKTTTTDATDSELTDLWHDTLADKRFKELKAALFPFGQAMHAKFDPIDYPARTTVLLQRRQWGDALFSLKAVAHFGSLHTGATVKRGTIQRWVRWVDECPKVGLRFKLIRAILACTSDDVDNDANADDDKDNDDARGGPADEKEEVLNQHDPKRVMQSAMLDSNDDGDNDDDDYEALVTKRSTWITPTTTCEATLEPQFPTDVEPTAQEALPEVTEVHHITAANRKPPNHHDLRIFATPANAVLLSTSNASSQPSVQRHDICSIPGAFLLQGVLTAAECCRIVQLAEHTGFVPDHPVTADRPTGIDTCEWMADESLLVQPIQDRVLSLLPDTIEGEAVAGINARWRLFRYGPDSVYRPHIDGSWPASGLDEKGVYQTHDSRKSRLTFLIYLNDAFQGGGTTFYLPAASGGGGGSLEAVAVQPQQGSVLCFPQGNTASLVHEGSRVTGGGCKYVIRTDVLYHSKRTAITTTPS
jgi:hypothetical protein